MSDSDALSMLDHAVERLLAHVPTDGGSATDLDAIAELLGVTVDSSSESVAEGSLRLRRGRAVIEISRWGSPQRRRFTLAHELGHVYLLHPRRSLAASVVARWPNEEAFCNDFAASVLLPITPLHGAVSEESQSLAGLFALARRFMVSYAATSVRLLRRNLWNRGLLTWSWCDEKWTLRAAAGLRLTGRHRLRLEETSAWRLRQIKGTEQDSELTLRFHVGDVLRHLDAQVRVNDFNAHALAPLCREASEWRLSWRAPTDRVRPFRAQVASDNRGQRGRMDDLPIRRHASSSPGPLSTPPVSPWEVDDVATPDFLPQTQRLPARPPALATPELAPEQLGLGLLYER